MKRWFCAIVALQLLFLVGEVATKEMAIRRAETVLLRTAPIDPRSLFAGNYIWLSYDISTIDLNKLGMPQEQRRTLKQGSTVYVRLIASKPWAKLDGITTQKPEDEEGFVYLKGRITSINDVFDSAARVDYGLDRYYIPETKSEEVAKLQRWGGKQPVITVEVAVTGSGQGMIRQVLVDGKPLGF